jgi:hypothetical protein
MKSLPGRSSETATSPGQPGVPRISPIVKLDPLANSGVLGKTANGGFVEQPNNPLGDVHLRVAERYAALAT